MWKTSSKVRKFPKNQPEILENMRFSVENPVESVENSVCGKSRIRWKTFVRVDVSTVDTFNKNAKKL